MTDRAAEGASEETPFPTVSEYPGRVGARGVMARMLDGLGFRFYWATEGLSEEDYAFCPEGGVNSLGVMARHIWGLTNWMRIHLLGEKAPAPWSGSLARQDPAWFNGSAFSGMNRRATGPERD